MKQDFAAKTANGQVPGTSQVSKKQGDRKNYNEQE